MDFPLQHLLRGGSISLTDWVSSWNFEGLKFFDLTSIVVKKYSNTNWDHSTHYVKVSSRLSLFPRRRRENKFRWESKIRKIKKKKTDLEHPQ